MMDLYDLVDTAIDSVNPDEIVQVVRSTGFTIGTGRKQLPTYAAPVQGYAQVQALDNSDLKQIDGLNIQGDIKAIYVRGSLAGAFRPEGEGADMVMRGVNFTETWLVTKILEQWPNWTKAVIVRQM